MKSMVSAREAKVNLKCPRCGLQTAARAIDMENTIFCSRCGLGMKEIKKGKSRTKGLTRKAAS